MHLTPLLTLLPLAAATITKRCSPLRDPDLALGYLPPAPCWQTFDPACRPHLLQGTTMTLDAPHGLAVVYGVSASCAAQIAEELQREKEGRKNYGWVRTHGWLTVIEPQVEGGERVLVVSGMGEEAVRRYQGLGYQ